MSSRRLRAGDDHYTAYVGPPAEYDFMGATQFRLLASLGLRQDQEVLDFGCGSLRAGRLLIPYLRTGRYYGIEPNRKLIDDAIEMELGTDILRAKMPHFAFNDDFRIPFDGKRFDFIVAQSIFSHASPRVIGRALASFSEHLAETGLVLATFIEGSNDYDGEEDWIYPGCVSYTRRRISSLVHESGYSLRRLPWFHPRQTWYVLCSRPDLLPSRLSTYLLLGGEVLRDPRFRKQSFFGNRLTAFSKRWRSGRLPGGR